MEAKRESDEMHTAMPGTMTSAMLSHALSPDDADNPMNWPTHRRLYASSVSWAMAFAV